MDDPGQMIDLVFGVRGSRIPSDYRFALWSALRKRLPWVDEEARAGIVGIGVTQTGGPMALLARRAKLTLRVPCSRVEAAQRLEGAHVDFASESIEITTAHPRALAPAATIYAQVVVLGPQEQPAFEGMLTEELQALGLDCRFILGRRRSLRAGAEELVGYSVALHGCNLAHSLRLQQLGLGAERGLGCGIFVPHKRIEASE